MMCGRPEGNGIEGRSAVVRCRLLSWEAVRCSCDAQDGGDEAIGGPAWVDVMEVLGGRWHSLVGGEQCEGRHSVGSERSPVWRADPQLLMTRRCMRRQQRQCSALGTEEHDERQSRVDGESSVAVAGETRRQARLCLGA
jgi:hypothetical protein